MAKKKIKTSVVIVTRNRKDELFECLHSIFNQNAKANEVVVVDNNSDVPLAPEIYSKYPDVCVITTYFNMGGSGGRNLGYANVSGEFILFMDDDAVADKDLIKELLSGFSDDKVGIVQPKIYSKEDRKKIQGVGHGINLKTGRVFGIGVGEIDKGQYDKNIEVPMVGCTWMVRREVFDKIGLYDDDLFIPYEDSDFCLRATNAGYKVVYIYKGRVWHRGPKDTGVPHAIQWIGITTPERAYRSSRNKIIFMKKHAGSLNFLFFVLFLMPLYAVSHTAIIVSERRFDILANYWRGYFSGLQYVLKHVDL